MINNVNKYVECNLLARFSQPQHFPHRAQRSPRLRQEKFANAACNLMGRLAYKATRRMHSRNRSEILRTAKFFAARTTVLSLHSWDRLLIYAGEWAVSCNGSPVMSTVMLAGPTPSLGGERQLMLPKAFLGKSLSDKIQFDDR